MGKPHHKLEVWRRSISFVQRIYEATADFPDLEKFGLVSQMRRASVSVPSNIAEGAARNSKKEFMNFLHIAQGSISELETQIIISGRLGFLGNTVQEELLNELEELSRMVLGLQRNLKKDL